MEITYKEIGDVSVVSFAGRIIYDTEEIVKKELDRIIKSKQKKIVFNLSELTYINSSGLGLLINVLKQVRANNGDIKLSNLRPELNELFRITSLNSVFDIFAEEADAQKKYDLQSAE
jgi:anti-sigma B factor antagonist